MAKKTQIDGILFCRRGRVFLIAGPCVIESEKMALDLAEAVKKVAVDLKMDFVFKASYDKANRSSIKSFRGPGIKEGLRILSKVKKLFGVPVLTDVHCSRDVEAVAEVADVIQIPAFLCRQTDLIVSAARTGKIINIKKGQFLSPNDMKNIVGKAEHAGNRKILLTERGTCFGYNNLVVDMRSIVIMKTLGYPVVFDATHSVQIPGGLGDRTGGQSEFIFPLSRAAVAAGADGLFLEVHRNPEKAMSDGQNSLRVSGLKSFLTGVLYPDYSGRGAE